MKLKYKISTRRLTTAAMLIAMSALIGIFCKTYLNFFDGVLRVSFENLPTILAGIMFGPIIGGICGLATDIISYLISPQSYFFLPVVSLGSLLVGVISGIMAKYVVKRHGTLQILASGGAAHLVGSLIVKSIGLFPIYDRLILWRILLYVAAIIPIELCILTLLFKNRSFLKLVGETEKNDDLRRGA